VPADISTAEGISTVVSATARHFGGIDVLVINSTPPAMGSIDDLTDDDWYQAFEMITRTFIRFVREVAPYRRR